MHLSNCMNEIRKDVCQTIQIQSLRNLKIYFQAHAGI